MTKKVNHLFFHEWSEEMAWLLGFFAADGCVRSSHTISFKQKERRIIERIKKLLESEHAITKQIDAHAPRYELQYASVLTYEKLKELFGCEVKRKSLTLSFPPNIPKDYIRHFMRGCIDGDGSLFWRKCGVPHIKFVSGSIDFIRGFRSLLFEEIGIPATIHGDAIYDISYCGIQAKCIAWWLYNKISISLERKRDLAQSFVAWKPMHVWSKNTTDKMKRVFDSTLFMLSDKRKWNRERDRFIMLEDNISIREKAGMIGITYGAAITRRCQLRKLNKENLNE